MILRSMKARSMTGVLLGSLLALSDASALAQSLGEPLPGRARASDGLARHRTKADGDKPTAKPCPEYGPGFVRVEGSSLCVRIGGSVRLDMGKRSDNRFGSTAGGLVQLESRGETGLGPVRVVVRGRGQIENGLGPSAYRY